MLKYHSLRDKVFSIKNLYSAFQLVKRNKGKAGLDRVSIKQFEADLDMNIMKWGIHFTLVSFTAYYYLSYLTICLYETGKILIACSISR
jgi:hypothetical protein